MGSKSPGMVVTSQSKGIEPASGGMRLSRPARRV
jgi:hypothetical protein